jgi:hypothetical protein
VSAVTKWSVYAGNSLRGCLFYFFVTFLDWLLGDEKLDGPKNEKLIEKCFHCYCYQIWKQRLRILICCAFRIQDKKERKSPLSLLSDLKTEVGKLGIFFLTLRLIFCMFSFLSPEIVHTCSWRLAADRPHADREFRYLVKDKCNDWFAWKKEQSNGTIGLLANDFPLLCIRCQYPFRTPSISCRVDIWISGKI